MTTRVRPQGTDIPLSIRFGVRATLLMNNVAAALVKYRNNVVALAFAGLLATCTYLYLDNSCMRRWEGVPVQTRWAWGECQVKVDELWREEGFAVNYLKSKFARDGFFILSSSAIYSEEFQELDVHSRGKHLAPDVTPEHSPTDKPAKEQPHASSKH
ncbi:hypothetical protein Illi2_00057 [Pseudomonas phage vB_PpuM-Illi-2]